MNELAPGNGTTLINFAANDRNLLQRFTFCFGLYSYLPYRPIYLAIHTDFGDAKKLFNYRAKRRILNQPSGTCRARLTNRKSNEVAVLPFDRQGRRTDRQTETQRDKQTEGMANVISISCYMCWGLTWVIWVGAESSVGS